jgi:hypothetical protein
MNMLAQEQHIVCKVEGHHSRDGFDNIPNMLCSGQSACEVVLVLWPASLDRKARSVEEEGRTCSVLCKSSAVIGKRGVKQVKATDDRLNQIEIRGESFSFPQRGSR